MRAIFRYTGIVSASTFIAFSSLASSNHSNNPVASNSKVIYGLSNTQHVKESPGTHYYVQAATFSTEKKATLYQHQLEQKFHQPVAVKKSGHYFLVLVGPLNSVAEVKALNNPSLRAPLQKTASRSHVTGPVFKHGSKVVIGDKDGLDPTVPNHLDVIGALGVASLNAGDSYLGVTSSETDRLVQTNSDNWNNLAAQLGFGYVFYRYHFNPYSDQAQWFTALEPELNGYYIGQNNIKGNVWRFGSPLFNDMTYTMPFESYRLMVDGALTILSKRQYSLYVKGGIGNAWNRSSYSDVDNDNTDPCSNQRLTFDANTHTNFAWEAGAGLNYVINNRVGLSLEYLYANLGTVSTSAFGNTGAITAPVIVPANFNLSAQTVQLGLHIAV